MKRIVLAGFLALSTPALADDLTRLEAATEAATRQLNAFLVSRAPELGPVMPSEAWDSRFRNAGRCFLNEIARQKGDAGVATYLNALEGWGQTKITSMSQLGRMPAPLVDAAAQSAAKTCKTIELATFRMYQSGMLQMMQDPAVIEKLKD